MGAFGRSRDRGRGRPSGVAAAWTPARIGGQVLWLQDSAADITVATGISNWTDASGSSHPLSQATGTAQPAYSASLVNGHPGGTANGTTQWLNRGDICGLAAGAARSLWVVAKLASAAARTPFLGVGDATGAQLYLVIEANTFATAGSKFGVYAQGTTYDCATATDTGWHVHVLTVSDMTVGVAKAGVLTYYCDGAASALTVKNAGTATWTTQSGWNQTSLFAFPGLAVAGGASVVSAGITNTVMTAGEVASLQAYAKARWGTP